MKKLTAILLALALALSLCAFAADDVTGVWYASIYGMKITMNVNADGTYAMDIMGENREGTWKLEGDKFITDPGAETEVEMTYDGTKIFAADEEMTLEFTREEPVAFEAAAIRTDAVEADFAGDWTCNLVEFFGMQMDPAEAGLDLQLNVEGTTVTMAVSGMGDDEPASYDTTLTDGALVVLEGTEEIDISFMIYALEDGTLCVALDLMGEPVNFYMVHAEAVEEAA